ncbi:MAG: GNAT family N-acetyltransferase [Candidatus Eisenbacteria bacterium]|uniref:GNAT family N-acetyltransferase n=1 Tax=Eiseniibacteriota bacterium TaxID=2212470 RepID=A0A948RWE7_UNCEI|nr:GNAT family N-acetyltransferase [Candidatus Eisenbacteria bacterium]MBU2692253.1 GNAT family N-acetyltransferase [Candidatus Eisenbacteria bacterium]
MNSDSDRVFIAFDNDLPLGILIATERSENHFEIRNIFVEPVSRRSGVGRQLIYKLISSNENTKIETETDDDTVAFYHSLGFRIHSLGETYPGVIRYRCNYDHTAWTHIACTDVVNRFEQDGVLCWISGGWAVDLHLGRQTRAHDDIDISILRADQLKLKNLFPGWEIFHTHAPGLRYWNGVKYLHSIPNVWLRENSDSPWAVEVLFQESKNEMWQYRRIPSIQRSVAEIGLISDDGLPYLRPEIQLLYKGGGTSYRKKDLQDLIALLPVISPAEKSWLVDSIRIEFPEGHDWIEIIENENYT